MMVDEMKDHLNFKIIPFWRELRDREFGGYYGYKDFDLNVDRKAVKGCILHSRILWFFSNAAMTLDDEELMGDADHTYDFISRFCIDRENGGVFWALNYDGSVSDDIKHTYNQAFAIYALSSYYDATVTFNRPCTEAIGEAWKLYDLIEGKCRDEIGYLEAFTRDFQPESNEKLSENGVMAEKTMNTLLHVFEAYTELLRVTKKYPDSAPEGHSAKDPADRLRWMMDTIADKIYNPALHRQEVFFDKYYNSIIDLHSYGHDIETAWLVDRGTEVLEDPVYTAKMSPVTEDLTRKIYERAYDNHSLLNECERGVDNKNRIWWVQAEAVLGFYNGYEKNPEHREYLAAAEDIWQFIRTKLTDPRTGGEWYWMLDENLKPVREKPFVEPWKCPYHNGRMCMEMIHRSEKKQQNA